MIPAAESWSNTKVMVIPDDVGCESNSEDFKKFNDTFSKLKPSLVVSCFGTDDNQRFGHIPGYFWMLDEFAQAGAKVLHIDRQFSNRWQNTDIPVYHTEGNLSFATNLPEIAQMVEDWAWTTDRHYAPKSLEDVEGDVSFADVIKMCHI